MIIVRPLHLYVYIKYAIHSVFNKKTCKNIAVFHVRQYLYIVVSRIRRYLFSFFEVNGKVTVAFRVTRLSL
jgi:hypothetical protein